MVVDTRAFTAENDILVAVWLTTTRAVRAVVPPSAATTTVRLLYTTLIGRFDCAINMEKKMRSPQLRHRTPLLQLLLLPPLVPQRPPRHSLLGSSKSCICLLSCNVRFVAVMLLDDLLR